MPTTTNLGLAVSSNQNDSVLEYWNKMLNESDGNFVLLDNEFGVLKSSISFEIPSTEWTSAVNGPFKASATVTLSDTVIRDGSVVEAYFSDIVNSAGVVLYSVTQSGTDVELVFYANEIKQENISGFIKYVYGVEAPTPSGPTIDATLENNSWDTIKSVCEAGNAANYWAVGDTKTDVGEDSNTRTFRIVDMQGLYNKHVVFMQVECENTSYMKHYTDGRSGTTDDNGCTNNYSIAEARITYLPEIMAKYSNDLQTNLTDTTYKVQKNGKTATILDLTDKLFLSAEKEICSNISVSPSAESNALTTFSYYTSHSTSSDRTKNSLNGSQMAWWLRSSSNDTLNSDVYVATDGNVASKTGSSSLGLSPLFSF